MKFGIINLNTSHVKVQHRVALKQSYLAYHLNTSHVKVQQSAYGGERHELKFKYISC